MNFTNIYKNLISNYFSYGLMLVVNIIIIPLYLRLLGFDEWGIVALCISLQSFLMLLDAGISQVMPRDIARVTNNNQLLTELYKTYFNSFLILATFGFLSIQIIIPLIISFWIPQIIINKNYITYCLHIITIQYFFQLLNNANTGFWTGTESQNKNNFIQLFFYLNKHAFTYCYLYFVDNRAICYVSIFSLFTFFEWLFNYSLIRKTLTNYSKYRNKFNNSTELLKSILKLSVGIIIGSLVTQIDKLILSSKLEASYFGQYVIITSLGVAMMQLQAPIFKAFLPKLSSSSGRSFMKIGLLVFVLIVIFCILPVIIVLANSHLFLETWTHNIKFADENYFLLELICISVLINYVYNFIYHLLLINNNLNIIFYINLVAFITITPIVYFLSGEHGALAGGFAWILLSLFQLIIGLIWLSKNHFTILKANNI